MSARSAIVVALELLEVGDQAEAVDVLLAALEEVPTPSTLPPVCQVCGARAWPEDKVRHIYSRHARAERRAAA